MKSILISLPIILATLNCYSQHASNDSSLIPRLALTSNILFMKCDVSIEHYDRAEIVILYMKQGNIVAHLIVASSNIAEILDTTFILTLKQKEIIESFGKGIRQKNLDASELTLGGTLGRYRYEIGEDQREYIDNKNRSLVKLLLP